MCSCKVCTIGADDAPKVVNIIIAKMNVEVMAADEGHKPYIPDILAAIYEASKVKGNSIEMRDPDYLGVKYT